MENGKKLLSEEDSFLLVKFDGPTSTEFGVSMNNVSPFQLLMLSEYMRMKAEVGVMVLEQQKIAKEQMSKIQVPGQETPPL